MIVISMILIETITISTIAIETVGEQIHSHPKGPIFSIYYVLLNSNCTCFTCKNKKKRWNFRFTWPVSQSQILIVLSWLPVYMLWDPLGNTIDLIAWKSTRWSTNSVKDYRKDIKFLWNWSIHQPFFQKLLNTDNHKTQSINQNLDSFLVHLNYSDGVWVIFLAKEYEVQNNNYPASPVHYTNIANQRILGWVFSKYQQL